MVLLDLRSRLVLLFARRVWRLDLFPMSCQNHHLPRKDQMFYLPDREIAERSPDSLVGSRRRRWIHRGPPGRSVLPNPKTHTRTRRKPALAIQKPAFPTS